MFSLPLSFVILLVVSVHPTSHLVSGMTSFVSLPHCFVILVEGVDRCQLPYCVLLRLMLGSEGSFSLPLSFVILLHVSVIPLPTWYLG